MKFGQKGYSLLEVMISMLILGIAFLALIATQFGSLNGYVSARDTLEAAEIGRRTAEILHIQGSQWVENVDGDADPATPPTYSGVPVYAAGAPTPFDATDPIQDILDANGEWLPLVNVPVDGRFNRRIAAISDNHVGGRFCIYAKGAPMASAFENFGGGDVVAALRFQIAVVYPGARVALTDCTFGGPVQAADLDDVGDRVAGTPPPLELEGLRVSYFGTLVVRRAYLTNFAAGGP